MLSLWEALPAFTGVCPDGGKKHTDCHNWRMDVHEGEQRRAGAQMMFESHVMTFLIIQVITSIYGHLWVLLPSGLKHPLIYIWGGLKQRKKTENFQTPLWRHDLGTCKLSLFYRGRTRLYQCGTGLCQPLLRILIHNPWLFPGRKTKGMFSTKTPSLLCT